MESFQDIEHFVKTLSAAIKKKIPTKVSQLTNDAGYKTTDTTYKLSKTGSTVTLTGSDGSTTSVTDDNATYSSLKNPYSLDIQNNGTTVASYDGSTAKTANFTNATSSADGLMSKTDKARLDDIAYSAEGIIDQIVNLTAEEWTGDEAPYSQTVNVTGMTSELLCELFSACSKSATVAERKAYNKAYAIVASGYAETADGSVMFYVNEKPSIDIAVRIKSIPKANVVSDQTSITDLQSKLTSLNADLAKQNDSVKSNASAISTLNSDLEQFPKIIGSRRLSGTIPLKHSGEYIILAFGEYWGNYAGLYLLSNGETATIITVKACEHLATLTVSNDTLSFSFDTYSGVLKVIEVGTSTY